MKSAKSMARLIGLLLFIQLAGLIIPFVLLRPMMTADFLTDAARYSSQIKVAVFLLFWNCALTIGISIVAWPVLRRYSEAGALLLLVVSAIMFTLQAVDNAHLMSMLSLSQQYAQAGGPEELLRTLAEAIRSTRRWTHYSELLAIDAWIFVFYGLLFRFALAPRALAAFGLLTVILHFMGIILPLFLGYSSVTLMGATMALSHLCLVMWLATRGFAEVRSPLLVEASAAHG